MSRGAQRDIAGTLVRAGFEPWWNLTGGDWLPPQAFRHTVRSAGSTRAIVRVEPLICYSAVDSRPESFLSVTYLVAQPT